MGVQHLLGPGSSLVFLGAISMQTDPPPVKGEGQRTAIFRVAVWLLIGCNSREFVHYLFVVQIRLFPQLWDQFSSVSDMPLL